MTADAKKWRRIATEEAFSIPEVAAGLRDVARAPGNSLDLILVQRIYDAKVDDVQARLLPRLLDLEDERLREPVARFTDVYESARFGNSVDDVQKLPALYDAVEIAMQD